MSNFLFEGGYKKRSTTVQVKLFLIHFQDENNIHFIFSPHLDLTGYGNDLIEAQKSFEIVLDDFIDYTISKKTFGKVLRDLGWKMKGTVKVPKKMTAPSITSVIADNKYVSELFDKYNVNTYHQEVRFPVMA